MTTVTAFREYLAQHGTATAIQFLESIGENRRQVRNGLGSTLTRTVRAGGILVQEHGKSALYHVYKHGPVPKRTRVPAKSPLTIPDFRHWLEKNGTGRPIDYIKSKGCDEFARYKLFQDAVIKAVRCDRLRVIEKHKRGFLYSVFRFEVLRKKSAQIAPPPANVRAIVFDPDYGFTGATVVKYKAQPAISYVASYAGASSIVGL